MRPGQGGHKQYYFYFFSEHSNWCPARGRARRARPIHRIHRVVVRRQEIAPDNAEYLRQGRLRCARLFRACFRFRRGGFLRSAGAQSSGVRGRRWMIDLADGGLDSRAQQCSFCAQSNLDGLILNYFRNNEIEACWRCNESRTGDANSN